MSVCILITVQAMMNSCASMHVFVCASIGMHLYESGTERGLFVEVLVCICVRGGEGFVCGSTGMHFLLEWERGISLCKYQYVFV